MEQTTASHPAVTCPEAARLLSGVWAVSPIILVDTNEMYWYSRAKEREAELQKRHEYRNATNNYTQHLSECEDCQRVLEGLNHDVLVAAGQ
jgi:hypothetical protein